MRTYQPKGNEVLHSRQCQPALDDPRTFESHINYVRAHGHTKGAYSTLSRDGRAHIAPSTREESPW